MGKQSFKPLLRSAAIILAFIAVLIDLLFGGTDFAPEGGIAPMNDLDVRDDLYD
ncbi:MAG: hypothetical protein NC543_10025 [bacterium]|nr:hypothetical protein [bacterium]MCM1374347.1 hypothetical protein [Muribaculum sp.]